MENSSSVQSQQRLHVLILVLIFVFQCPRLYHRLRSARKAQPLTFLWHKMFVLYRSQIYKSKGGIVKVFLLIQEGGLIFPLQSSNAECPSNLEDSLKAIRSLGRSLGGHSKREKMWGKALSVDGGTEVSPLNFYLLPLCKSRKLLLQKSWNFSVW